MNVFPGRLRDLGRSRLVALAVVAAAALAVLSLAPVFTRAQDATPTPGACPTGTPTASPTATASPAAGENCVTIEMVDIRYTVNSVTIPANQPVTFVLHNTGATAHNFSITDKHNSGLPNLDISVTVQPGEMQQVTVNAPPGTYYFFCNFPGHEAAGMWGWLTVQEGGQISAEEATVTPPPA